MSTIEADLDLLLDPAEGATEAMIERVVHLGFEVLRADRKKLWAQITRDRCEELELAAGQIVYVRPARERLFA